MQQLFEGKPQGQTTVFGEADEGTPVIQEQKPWSVPRPLLSPTPHFLPWMPCASGRGSCAWPP